MRTHEIDQDLSIAGKTLTDDDGIWIEIADHRCRPRRGRRAALFLDRDGVIVEDTGFLSREADVRLVAGASAVVAGANRLGVPVIIVSNQSGIGRGFFDWAAFARVQTRIAALLARDAASIDAVLACPHHPPKRLTPIRTHRGASRIRECC
jgi:D-glycero-D-manno-heptose 1,7-bisphosphate phosphatase